MAWPTNPRPAYSLSTLKSQLDATYPGYLNLGMLGDAAHQAVASDHNPNAAGVVTAFDIGPGGGLDIHALANNLQANRHPDLKYIISNRRIVGAWTNWQWSTYSGSDPHDTHIHISVGVGPDGQSTQPYDDRINWNIQGGDEMVENSIAWFERVGRLHRQVTGNSLSKTQFDKDFVGQSLTRVVDLISNNNEANTNTYMADIGRRALGPEDWPKQIRDWRALAEKLAAEQPLTKVTQAKIDSLAKQADDLEQAIKAANQ